MQKVHDVLKRLNTIISIQGSPNLIAAQDLGLKVYELF